MDTTLIPVPRPAIKIRNWGGKIILAIGTDALELSESAELLWRTIDPGRSVDDIITRVAESYGLTSHEVAQDVTEWLTEMEASGYLELRPRR